MMTMAGERVCNWNVNVHVALFKLTKIFYYMYCCCVQLKLRLWSRRPSAGQGSAGRGHVRTHRCSRAFRWR